MTKQEKITCICPSGLEYDKDHVSTMKEWRKIVLNYLKIYRLINEHKLNLEIILIIEKYFNSSF